MCLLCGAQVSVWSVEWVIFLYFKATLRLLKYKNIMFSSIFPPKSCCPHHLPTLLVPFVLLDDFLLSCYLYMYDSTYLYKNLSLENERKCNICLSEIELVHLIWLSLVTFIFTNDLTCFFMAKKFHCVYKPYF